MTALRFAADENLNERLVLALLRRLPSLDVRRVRDTPAAARSDGEVLAWAAEEERIVISHDARTMPAEAWTRIDAGLVMPGLLVVADDAPPRTIVEQLALLAEVGTPADFADRVLFLPAKGPDAGS